MSVAIVHDWKFKKDANIGEAMAAAAELVRNFKNHHPGVQLSLWLKNHQDPQHYWHITVFDTQENMDKVRESEGIDRFVKKFYPHMDRSTHNNPQTDVVILGVQGLQEVVFAATR